MFLDALCRRNQALVAAAIRLHQQDLMPANTYLLDLDTVRVNARVLREEGDRCGLTVFAMTKQVGRNPSFCRAVREGGIDAAVAVDMECARVTRQAGLRLGHLGHLVRVPRAEARGGAALEPDYWTVFNFEKAAEASAAAGLIARRQDLLARVQAPGDRFYLGQEGGFEAGDILEVAARLDALPHARFAGITTFPAMLFDPETRRLRPTPNLATLQRAADQLARAGRSGIEINAPGTNSSVVFRQLADLGATQVEPGHGLTGTTPLHVYEDLPERPAVVYVSEVSRAHGVPYCVASGRNPAPGRDRLLRNDRRPGRTH